MTPRAAAVNQLARDILAAFGERDALVHFFARKKWTQIEGGNWRSEGGRVLSDASYQKLQQRLKDSPGRQPRAKKEPPAPTVGNAPGGTGGPAGFGTDRYVPHGREPLPPGFVIDAEPASPPPPGPRRSETAAPRTGVTPQGNRVTLQPRKPATATPTEPRLTGEAKRAAIAEAVKGVEAQAHEQRRLVAGALAGAVPTKELLKQNARLNAASNAVRDAFDGKPAPPPTPAETAHLDAAQAKDTARFGPRGASILRRAAEAVRGLLTLGGLVTGAGIGATVGTAVGGPLGLALGTAIGGGLGGLAGSRVVGDGRSVVSRRKDARTAFAETGLPPNAAAILKARLVIAAHKAGVTLPPIPPGAIEKALEMAAQDADTAEAGQAVAAFSACRKKLAKIRG